jgi:predicted O-linked N-acetylglucosamine transferase (SPINDLY family)
VPDPPDAEDERHEVLIMYSKRLEEILMQLGRSPADIPAARRLLGLRHEIAQTLLATPVARLESLYKGDLGEACFTMLNGGIPGYPPLEEERQFVADVMRQVTGDNASQAALNTILAAMLYENPYKYLSCERLPEIPVWLLRTVFRCVLGQQWLFREKGEIELYYRALSRWMDYLHANILGNPDSARWQEVLRAFLQYASFVSLYFSWHNLRDICRQRAELIEFAQELWGARPGFEFGPRARDAGRIRFGVLMQDFDPRSETFATLPVFEHLDREAIEIVLVTRAMREKKSAELEEYCAARADRLVEIPADIKTSVEIIRALDLDAIWIGTNMAAGASTFVQLCAHRLARLQLTGGCSPVTTGFHNMDVFVSGHLAEPTQGAQEQYTERLACMNGPVLCFDFAQQSERAPTQAIKRDMLGIPEGATAYAAGANFFKITPELEEAWIRILATVPGSRLLLYPFNLNWTNYYLVGPFFLRITATCKRLGVEANRVAIKPPLPDIADVRAMLGRVADVYLDSFPHSGMTSLIDPLLAGVPTVVLEGNSQRSRMASGALRDMDLPGLIAADEESYILLAAALGQDRERRQRLAGEIRRKMVKPPKFLDPKWCGMEMTRMLKELVVR